MSAVISTSTDGTKRVKRDKGILNLRRQSWMVDTFKWDGEREFELLTVQLRPAMLEAPGMEPVVGALPLLAEDGVVDSHLATLMLAMQWEVTQGCSCGSLYGETLSFTLAIYSTSRYGLSRRSVTVK